MTFRLLARPFAFISLFLLASAFISTATAQRVKKSQTGIVSQEIAKTKIEIKYDRPLARGRELFGKLVKWDKIWTPSANSPTMFETTGDITLNGGTLKSGKYSVWAIPGKDEWTFWFDTTPKVFHLNHPEADDERIVLIIAAKPEEAGMYMETLTFNFPVVNADGATLHFHWGNTIVPIEISLN